jgi:hypothetical protein
MDTRWRHRPSTRRSTHNCGSSTQDVEQLFETAPHVTLIDYITSLVIKSCLDQDAEELTRIMYRGGKARADRS